MPDRPSLKERIEEPWGPLPAWKTTPLLPEWEGDGITELPHDAPTSDRVVPALRSLYNSFIQPQSSPVGIAEAAIPFPPGLNVYHGSPRVFKRLLRSRRRDTPLYPGMIHFAEDPSEAAAKYSLPGGSLFSARLDLDNALDTTNPLTMDDAHAIMQSLKRDPDIFQRDLRRRDPYHFDDDTGPVVLGMDDWELALYAATKGTGGEAIRWLEKSRWPHVDELAEAVGDSSKMLPPGTYLNNPLSDASGVGNLDLIRDAGFDGVRYGHSWGDRAWATPREDKVIIDRVLPVTGDMREMASWMNKYNNAR